MRNRKTILPWLASLGVAAGLLIGIVPARSQGLDGRYAATVKPIEALPYQAAYVPSGFDAAFPGQHVLNTAPA